MLNNKNTDIAIVGIGLHLPGATNTSEYWERLKAGKDLSRVVPDKRWPVTSQNYVSSAPQPDKVRSLRGYYLDNVPAPQEEGLPAGLDPIFPLSLHTARQALADTRNDLHLAKTGIIMAAIALPTDTTSQLSEDLLSTDFTLRLVERLPQELRSRLKPENATTLSAPQEALAWNASPVGLPAQMIAQRLGLELGGYTLDAACASSLVAVELACAELREHRADAMLAGGISRPDCLYTQMGFSALRALSASGLCAPFDTRADGLMVGEGCGMVVLKRLEDAVDQGDHIYGVIKAVGLSNDIEGSLVAPSSEGQLRCLKEAYQRSGLNPWDVQLIECHGTGTPVGDKVEFNSLQTLWQEAPAEATCQLRSVKSMVGHLLTAAGAAGLIRVLLNLQHGLITPQVNFKDSNLPLETSHFRITSTSVPWPAQEGAPRRAAVSGFGFGGINAHLILEEAPLSVTTSTDANAPTSTTANPARTCTNLDSCDTATSSPAAIPDSEDTEPIAIIGLSCQLGRLKTLEEFTNAVFNGTSILHKELPSNRWQGLENSSPLLAQATSGAHPQTASESPTQIDSHTSSDPNSAAITDTDFAANLAATNSTKKAVFEGCPNAYIESAEIPIGKFHVPPTDIPNILPQQSLLLDTAAQAMQDAKQPLRGKRPQASAFVGISLDLNSTNFGLRWRLEEKAQHWAQNLGLSKEESQNWIENLKAEISTPLDATRTMGALGSIAASRLAREFQFGGCSFAVSAQEASGLEALQLGINALRSHRSDLVLVGAIDLSGDVRSFISQRDGDMPLGEGACCLVLKRLSEAERDGDHIYCQVEALGQNTSLSQALQSSCEAAQVSPAHISSLELAGQNWLQSGPTKVLKSLRNVLEAGQEPLAVGSLTALTGHCGAACGLASVVKTALSLDRLILSPQPDFTQPWNKGHDWKDTRFFVPKKPSFWFRDRALGGRCAAIVAHSYPNQFNTVILKEVPTTADENVEPSILPVSATLFVTYAPTAELLRERLQKLQTLAEPVTERHLLSLSRTWQAEQNPQDKLALAFTVDLSAPNVSEEFTSRLNLALEHLAQHAQEELASHSVYYSPDPLASKGKTAFVYPGSGANFLGLGRELALYFPSIMREFDRRLLYMSQEFMVKWNQPYRVSWEDGWQHEAMQSLADDTHKMMFSQVSFGMLTTAVVRHIGVEPQAAIGDSLGESSALFSLGAWTDPDLMFKRMEGSELFRNKLSGQCLAARKAWNIPDSQPFEWKVGLMRQPAQAVRKAMEHIPKLRLLIINTDNECVVGGTPEALEALAQELGVRIISVSGVDTVHCDCLDPVYQEYWDMHHLPCRPPVGIDFYSGRYHCKYNLTSERIADSIVAHGRFGFDFTKTIRQAWQDGVRIFLEMGPGASCTRMINSILADKPHMAVSLSTRGKNELLSLEGLLAAAISQGLRPDLNKLWEVMSISEPAVSTSRLIKVPLGRKPFAPPLPKHIPSQAPNPGSTSVQASSEKSAPLASATIAPPTPEKAPNSQTTPAISNQAPATPFVATPIQEPATSAQPPLNQPAAAAPLPIQEAASVPMEQLANLLVSISHNSQANHAKWLEFVRQSTQSTQALLTSQTRLVNQAYANGWLTVATTSQETQPAQAVPLAKDVAKTFEPSATFPGATMSAAVVPQMLGSAPVVTTPTLATTNSAPVSLQPDSATAKPTRAFPITAAPSNQHHSYTHKLHGLDITTMDGFLSGSKPSLAPPNQKVFLDRRGCLEFATGKIGNVLGQKFAPIDNYSTRVRLPDEPLMLVDRILSIEGEPLSLGTGRVVTEHDVIPGMWYLDNDRAPVFISVEAGQADLFLCSWLGIDFKAQGKRVYRLLDANVIFHRGLPRPGETIHYDIHIKRFINQGDIWLFFFEYEADIAGQTFLTMRNGCAGFFTHEEIRNNGGLVLTEEDLRPKQGRSCPDPHPWVKLESSSYNLEQVAALRRGDLTACFGAAFAGLPLNNPVSLPSGLLRLIHRIPLCDPNGGRWGLGLVIAEADVHPDDWYLTCHFVDDMVMPGTLMYECCAHALRFLLTSLGWVGEKDKIAYEPVVGTKAVLKCRGPVLQSTKTVRYRVEIKEIGYNPCPYVIADAIMYADSKRVVGFENISMQLTGTTREELDSLWSRRSSTQQTASSPAPGAFAHRGDPIKEAIFNEEQFRQFAVGKPSLAFGPAFAEFDSRFIARLPGDPYQFVSRIVKADHPFLKAVPGGWVEAQYDIPAQAWYFRAGHTGCMPFCVLNEIALQVCGWVSSYAGSSMHSSDDLHYRNLGGTSRLVKEITPDLGTVTIKVRMTRSSEAGGLIIQDFDMWLGQSNEAIYEGKTTFGFFTAQSLADQVGIRGAQKRLWQPAQPLPFQALPAVAPLDPSDPGCSQRHSLDLPGKALLMLDEYAWYPEGGKHGLGAVVGRKNIDPKEWFFKAHFFQDPVMPGSLGLEACLEAIKITAIHKWPELLDTHHFSAMAPGQEHSWLYRGQVIQSNKEMKVVVEITEISEGPEPSLKADGFLSADGRIIYEIKNFAVSLLKNN